MTRTSALLAAALGALVLSGCGEKEQVIVYKQGKYQGKPDAKPYDNPAFGNDKAKWEGTIKSRNHNQNEYRRING